MLRYINLTTTDPAFNLAAEQYVFETLPKDSSYIMLWQNDNAVIIGKYQNTLAEINLPYVEQHSIRVVRRLSGGGAVYHDLGNLNYSFISDAASSGKVNLRLFCEPVIHALAELGVRAEINGRNDMTVDGKKFSGNAQYIRGGRVLHHGTILFNSDLSVIGEALHVDRSKIIAKGIPSVRSRVTNLLPYFPDGTTLSDFRAALLSHLLAEEPGEEYIFSEKDLSEISRLQNERYSRWEWNFGRSPACTLKKSGRVDSCGLVEAYISLDRGLITAVSFCGAFFSLHDPDALEPLFLSKTPDEESFRAALKDVNVSAYFSGLEKEDLIRILCS